MAHIYLFVCLVYFDSILFGEIPRRRWGEDPERAGWRRLCHRIRGNTIRTAGLLLGWASIQALALASSDPTLAKGIAGFTGVLATVLGWGAVLCAGILAVQLAYAYWRARELGFL